MIQQIKLPSMGATMEEGTIVSWKVKEGDTVKTGQILLELESDKSVFEFESPCDGLVRKILAHNGDTVPVQSVIAIIGDADSAIPSAWLNVNPAAAPLTPALAAAAPTPVPATPAATAFDKGGPKISPRARKLAEQLGVDITQLAGSGPGGRIESADVEKAAQAQPAPVTAPDVSATAFDPVRLQINRKVVKSKQEIPHFYLAVQVDMTRAVALRQARGGAFSYNALLMKAIIAGLQTEPTLNAQYTPAGLVQHQDINLGLAIETPKGVVIAVVEKADQSDLTALTDRIKGLVEAGRAGDFKALPTHGACMTISNIGMYRVDAFFPIIHPGEAAIIGVGSLAERAVVVNGQVMARKTMPLSLCVDHRIADGAVAARFLKAMTEFLETAGGEK